MKLKKKSNLRNIVKRLSKPTKREKKLRRILESAIGIKASKKMLRRMIRTIPSGKKYKRADEQKDSVKGGKAIDEKIMKDDVLEKGKDMMKPNYHAEKEPDDLKVYDVDEGYKPKKEEKPQEYQKAVKQDGDVKSLMTKYLIKMYALPSKGPFRQLDSVTQRLKEIFLKNYK